MAAGRVAPLTCGANRRRNGAAPVIEAWRIVKRRFASTAFDGKGAQRFGGRWNSPGRPVVYTSESRALALLEILAGLGSTTPLPAWTLIAVRFPKEFALAAVELPGGLPPGWDAAPPSHVSRQVGDRWLDERASAVLRVPSVIVPAECNFLLNPAHPDFSGIETGSPEPLRLDPRLGDPPAGG
ncbi:MAG: RES family NAD+ phosphorylase [Gemmatimonadota bacterium]|nr:RES family NAD+ phosphorylase [Gemmatimonadota bacterium]